MYGFFMTLKIQHLSTTYSNYLTWLSRLTRIGCTMEAYKIFHHIFHVTNWICFNQDTCIKTVFLEPLQSSQLYNNTTFLEHLQV